MTAMALTLLVLGTFVGTILAIGAHHRSDPHRIDEGLRTLLREDQLSDLRARLDRGPSDVEAARVHALRNAVVLDLGDVRLAARCYRQPDDVPIWQLLGVSWHSYCGWVLDVNGPSGHRRISAWYLHLTPTR